MPLMHWPNWPQRDKNRAVPVSCAKDDCLLDKYTQRASLSYPGNKNTTRLSRPLLSNIDGSSI